MLDADEPGAAINEFLHTIVLPGIALFVGLWTLFRLH